MSPHDPLREKLREDRAEGPAREPVWMRGFGALSRLRKETERIQARIDEAFEVVEPEDRA